MQRPKGDHVIRVFLGDDHALVREGTRHMLEEHSDLKVIAEAGRGDETAKLIARHRPDVAVLDIRMPGINGIEIIRGLKDRLPSTRFLILSAYDDDEFVLAGMDAGASGYLLKTVKAAELASAVRAVHRGETVLHPEIGRKLAALWARRGAPRDRSALTPRELEVLELAARGLRNREIAEALGVSVRTVEGHFSAILGKLGLASRTAAVVYGAAHHWFGIKVDDHGPLRS